MDKLEIIMPIGAMGASSHDSALDSLMRDIGIKYSQKDEWAEKYGTNFKNEKFEMMTFYWGECECGHEEESCEWSENHHHSADCYQVDKKKQMSANPFKKEIDDLIGERRSKNIFSKEAEEVQKRINKVSDKESAWEKKIYKGLCKKHGIPYKDGWGCAVHCTCAYDKDWAEWLKTHQHKSDCKIIMPNFKHYETGLEVRWYKYIGRGMETNIDIDHDLLHKIRGDLLY